MANAARTMGLSGMQNLNNGEGKLNPNSHNQMKMETENSPAIANNQNNQVFYIFTRLSRFYVFMSTVNRLFHW